MTINLVMTEEVKEVVVVVEVEAVVEEVEMILLVQKIEIVNRRMNQAKWHKIMPKPKKAR
jgi:hypothetical protein